MARREPDYNQISSQNNDFVLDKAIFSNVFKKDIQKIYLLKKSERLATALQLVSPAFSETPVFQEQLDEVSVILIKAAMNGSHDSHQLLAEELIGLCSYLQLAKARGLLSPMNADLIIRETQLLVRELVGYEEPRLFLQEAPSLSELSKQMSETHRAPVAPSTFDKLLSPFQAPTAKPKTLQPQNVLKGHIKDITELSSRQESILDVLRSNGPSYIKDISKVVREVSEKTIQRELQVLVQSGIVSREGDRRWTQYSIPESL